MKAKILLLGITMLIMCACGNIPLGYPGVDNSPTSYRTGYGIRSNATGSVADSHMGWGE